MTGKNPLKNVYFGEEHMHTRNSFDAFTIGVNMTWEDAYKYAKGEEIKLSTTGEPMKKRTPYDFVAITDHAEYFGVLKEFGNPDSPLAKSDFAKGIVAGQTDPEAGGPSFKKLLASLFAGEPIREYATGELRTGMWQSYIDAADKANEPGKFTALYGYEWTSIPKGSNIHRNVFFKDKAASFPYSAFDGGWDFPEDLVDDGDFVEKAYENGVPMGRDLPEMTSEAKAPTLAVWAMKDPESGNLDRIQIIKVWPNPANGLPMEKIYDVAWSEEGKRQIGEDGKLPPVGNTVDVKTASYTNDIGATQLRAVWTDPAFNPDDRAAYYVRVLEIPTPRWSTYDAVKTGLPVPEGVPLTLQERAWSSPIWYTPARELQIQRKLKALTGENWGPASEVIEPTGVH